MNEDRLLQKLAQPEDAWVEFKESFHEEEIRKTLVAFANSVPEGEPAVLFIGASERVAHPGVVDADGDQKRVLAQAEQKSYPPITIQTKVLKLEGCTRAILAVIVPASRNKPHFGGTAWIRKGSQSIRAPEQVFKDLIASQNDKTRKLQNHGKEKLVLRMKSSENGFHLHLWNCQIKQIHSQSISIVDTASADSYSFDLDRLYITDVNQVGSILTLDAPWPRSEPDLIREVASRWSTANDLSIKSIKDSSEAWTVQQFLDRHEESRPIIASLMEGWRNPNLRLLLAALEWEKKKHDTPRTPEEKRLSIQKHMEKIKGSWTIRPKQAQLEFWAAGLLDAIQEVAISLEDAEFWLSAMAPNYGLTAPLMLRSLYCRFKLTHILG